MNAQELIAALEKATGPSRELDFWCWWWGKAAHDGQMPDADYAAENIKRADAPRYTDSIDAALTLVPETDGKRWYEIGQAWSQAVVRVRIYPPSPWEGRTREAAAEAPTPALALCIAALKARVA